MKDSPSLRSLAFKASSYKATLASHQHVRPENAYRPTFDVGTFGYWFVPIIGVIYAAGFLVATTFLREFGFNASELFKAKYIQVGGLFLMCCLVFLLPMFWILRGCSRPSNLAENAPWKLRWFLLTHWHESASNSWKPHLPGTVLYSAMIVTFYAILAFGDRNFFLNHAWKVLFNFVTPVIFTSVAFRPWFRRPRTKKKIKDGRIWFEAIAAVVCLLWSGYTLFLLKGSNHSLGTMFWHRGPTGAIGFGLFMFLIATYGLFGTNRFRHCADVGSRISIVLSSLCVIGALSYMSVLAFAYAIYPYIQSSRGGGALDDAVPVKLAFKPGEEPLLPPEVRDEIISDNSSFIILDQTNDAIFVASARDARGPRGWRIPLKKNVQDRRNKNKTKTTFEVQRPTVYEIRSSSIASIIYLNHYGQANGKRTFSARKGAEQTDTALHTSEKHGPMVPLTASHYTFSLDGKENQARDCCVDFGSSEQN